MKLLAQHGYGDGNKLIFGLKNKYIDGVIFSPRDINGDKLKEKVDEINDNYFGNEIFFDPQFYISPLGIKDVTNPGKLINYDYFSFKRKSELEREKSVREVITEALNFQTEFGFSSLISPNILINKSFDSAEAVISKNFIRLTKEIHRKTKDKRKIFATLAISRDTLANKQDLKEFLNDITILDDPPDGFYILVSARASEARSDIFNSNVISGWMFLNYTLNVNGFKIINGYSDILSVFLNAVGGEYGCTGWWSNLRIFSLDRFTGTQSGGRMPIQRYLSNKLLNRITHIELKDWYTIFPEILNGLKTDKNLLLPDPDRSIEVLQSWESLKFLFSKLKENDFANNLKYCENILEQASNLYLRIIARFRTDAKSRNDHIEPLEEGIKQFKKLAEFN